ncbi:dienelactone hydrolase family protein [Sphingomonas sp. MMS24-JH45]
MNEMNADRGLLRDHLAASLATLKAQAEVSEARTAAIGFCLAASASSTWRAAASTLWAASASTASTTTDYASVAPMTMKLLVCHGWDDPLAPPDALVALGRELTEAKADWQIHAYGNAGHAFTDKSRRDASIPGVAYEEARKAAAGRRCRISWRK